MKFGWKTGVTASGFILAACSSQQIPETPPTSAPISSPSIQFPVGALNPEVSQDTIMQTICVKGYTKTIRIRLSTKKGYQHDHFIPLELGGDPTNPNNLWFVPNERAHRDDEEENRLHRLVCSFKISLAEAQHEIIQEKEQP